MTRAEFVEKRVTHYGKRFTATRSGRLTQVRLPIVSGIERSYMLFPLRRAYTVKKGQTYFASCNRSTNTATIRKISDTKFLWTDVDTAPTLKLTLDAFVKRAKP